MTEEEKQKYTELLQAVENAENERERTKARGALRRWLQFNGFQ